MNNEPDKRDQLLAVIAHELRNPLTAITHAVYFGNENVEIPDDLKVVWDVIDRQSRFLAEMLNDLLDVSRLARNDVYLERQALNLTGLIEDVTSCLQPTAANRHQTLRFLNEGNTPVFGDRKRLRRAITNLIGNALKFSPNGGEITVRIKPDSSGARMLVSDTGPGIAPELRDRIFDMFFQGSSTGPQKGMGIGLFLVRQIAEEHGGSVAYENHAEGPGCTFCMSLPMTNADAIPGVDWPNRR